MVMNGSSIQRLHLVEKALSVESMIDYAKNGSLNLIISEMYYMIISIPLKAIEEFIIIPVRKMHRQLERLETNLREYQ